MSTCLRKTCGKDIKQTPGQKPKRYCNDYCRIRSFRENRKETHVSIPIDQWESMVRELTLLRGKVNRKEPGSPPVVKVKIVDANKLSGVVKSYKQPETNYTINTTTPPPGLDRAGMAKWRRNNL